MLSWFRLFLVTTLILNYTVGKEMNDNFTTTFELVL